VELKVLLKVGMPEVSLLIVSVKRVIENREKELESHLGIDTDYHIIASICHIEMCLSAMC